MLSSGGQNEEEEKRHTQTEGRITKRRRQGSTQIRLRRHRNTLRIQQFFNEMLRRLPKGIYLRWMQSYLSIPFALHILYAMGCHLREAKFWVVRNILNKIRRKNYTDIATIYFFVIFQISQENNDKKVFQTSPSPNLTQVRKSVRGPGGKGVAGLWRRKTG